MSAIKNGFQLVVLEDTGDTDIGTITITDAVNTQVVVWGGRTYVTHTTSGTALSSWSFDWTAPSSDVGAITFYAVFDDADNNGMTGGDRIYTNSLTIDWAVGIDQIANNPIDFQVYPNPVSDIINVSYELDKSNLVEITLVDIQGKEIAVFQSETESAGHHTHTFDISHYAPGVYYLTLIIDKEETNHKIVITTN